jgi:hypothetical protein
MTPISNAGIVNINARSCAVGFNPAATYAFDAEAETMTVTDTSTLADDDDIAIIHVRVIDAFGTVALGKIEEAEGDVEIDTSGLDPIDGLSVTVTFVTDNRLVADGSVYNVGTTAPAEGNIRYVNKMSC